MNKCKKCKLIITGDCMLTTGVCVFCHYGIGSWDSNGKLVTKKEATVRIIKLEESRKMEDYTTSLCKAIHYYWFERGVDLPLKRGSTIFTFWCRNVLREFDLKDRYVQRKSKC